MLTNDDQALLDLTGVIRRVLRARTSDTDLIEDLTQDTLLRVAVVQPQLDPDVLRAYSIVTARHALITHHRRRTVAQRHTHRMVEFTSIAEPEHATLERGETDALAVALDRLGPADRQLLLDHEVDNQNLDELAATHSTSPGAIAMRLSRARSLLRVEFVLAFRRLTLPTDRCRPVLLALSAGDTRRQTALDAPGHLLDCDTCAELVEPVARRKRSAAAWLIWPFTAIGRSVARFATQLRRNRWLQAVTVTVAVTAAGGVVAASFASQPDHTRAAPPATTAPSTTSIPATTPAATTLPSTTMLVAPSAGPTTPAAVPPSTTVPASPCAPLPPPSPSPTDANCTYLIDDLAVIDVPADEGFWVAYPDGQPIWIQLVGPGESPQRVIVGAHVSVRATITPASTTPPLGISSVDAERVAQRGVYLDVVFADLTVN